MTGVQTCALPISCVPIAGTEPCQSADLCKESVCEEPEFVGDEGTCDLVLLDAASCDPDELYCDGEQTCVSGECETTAYACVGFDPDSCEQVICDEESVPHCEVDWQLDGTSCADDDLCDGAEACYSGECLPGSPPCATFNECLSAECTQLDDFVECGDEIEVEDGTVCQTDDVCLGEGVHRCLGGVCSEAELPTCQPEDGDGSFCTKYLQCVEVDGQADCKFLTTGDSPIYAGTLACNPGENEATSFVFDTVTANNDVETYHADCPGNYSGGEEVYFVHVSPNQDFTVALTTDASTMGEDLVLLSVGEPCDVVNGSCYASDTGSMSITASAGGYGLVVIDGLDGNRGQGTISISCP